MQTDALISLCCGLIAIGILAALGSAVKRITGRLRRGRTGSSPR